MRISVQGQHPLQGDYYPSGNSNAAIATIAGALLSKAPVNLHNVPDTVGTKGMLKIAQHLGTTVSQTDNTLQLETPHLQQRILETKQSDLLAASVLFLAPILYRRGHARLEWGRPMGRLRAHIAAMIDLGFMVEIQGDSLEVSPEPWEERDIMLAFPSVTTTALVCMLAACFGHKTIIRNAASEPHVHSLQHLLVQMGAKIDGIGSNLLIIYGFENENIAGATLTMPSDHIEIASIAMIAAITEGQVAIHDVHLPDMHMILKILTQMGVQYYAEAQKDGRHILRIPHQHTMVVQRPFGDTSLNVETGPWPSLPSDLVAITTVLATQTRGSVLIHERTFNDRMLFIDKLKAMGAQIVLCDPHRAVVFGKRDLRGYYIDSPDVRVGLALLAAALIADGETIIDNAHLVDWAFENTRDKLIKIGAQIKVITP